MITNALLLFVIALGLVAVAILIAYIWASDPFKTALGSCLSSLALLVGSLSVPEAKGTTKFYVDIGFASAQSDAISFSTGTPPYLWIVAFVSIVLLVALFALLLFFQHRLPPQRGSRGQPRMEDGIGGPVF